jgi:hypothetical protein
VPVFFGILRQMPPDTTTYIWRAALDSASKDSSTVSKTLEPVLDYPWRMEVVVETKRPEFFGLPYQNDKVLGWYWWLYLVLWLAAMVWLRWVEGSGFRQFLGGVLQNARLRQFREEYGSSFMPPFFFLYFLSMLSPWLYLVSKGVLKPEQVWAWYGLGIWLVLPLIKSAVVGLTGRLFGLESWTSLHRLVSFQSQTLLGLWFFALMLPDMVGWLTPWPGWVLPGFGLGIVLIYQLFKLATLWRVSTFISLIYFLLYLCTLELLPLFWLVKATSIWI